MQKNIISLFLGLAFSLSLSAKSPAQSTAIEHHKFKLNNGLTLIIHQDKKAPLVAVNIWYHVGSKDEKPGKTGFAHLFEHLMFNGSEHYNLDWFKAFDKVGATGMNGTTNQDRTNYYQVVPKNALEMTLWLESDRMGHLLGAIDQAKLDEQRDVVKNEKRQRENQPYGKVFSTLLKNVYPAGHPYSWPVIGSMEDLNAASLEDVHEWFKTKYGAANATLVVAGDVEPKKVKSLVEKYFGDIAAGPPLTRQSSWIAKRHEKHTQTMVDRVPLAQTYKIWNIPGWGSEQANHLSLVSNILSSDKKSRLYNRLVYKEQIANDIKAFSFSSELGGLFGIVASVNDPAKLDYIEKAIDEELAKFIAKGPSKEELQRVKVGYRAGLIRSSESIANKAALLAKNQVFGDDPNYHIKELATIESATAKQVQQAAKQWLSDGEYVLRVLPEPQYTTLPSTVDRSKGLPAISEPPEVQFDTLQKATLSNGLKIILAERHSTPVVGMMMLLNGGFSADQRDKLGAADLTMQMLTEGSKSMTGVELSTKLAQLGTQISAAAGMDSLYITLDSLKDKLDKSLDIYADVLLNPSFPEAQLTRLKNEQLAAIAQSKSRPSGIAFNLLPSLLYGKEHSYSAPSSGAGTESTVAQLTLEDIGNYYQTWFKANNGTLIIVGDTTMQEILPLLEKRLSKMPSGEVPQKNIVKVTTDKPATIYLVDRPGSEQSLIVASKLLPNYGFKDELALQIANNVFGGSFNSRLNMTLREEKGWSYGARSFISNTQAQRPLIINAPVQTDKTAEAINEMHRLISNFSSSNPASADELENALNRKTLTLPGRWELSESVLGDIAKLVQYNLSDDYWSQYVKELKVLQLENINKAGKQFLSPDNLIWVVVGDRSKIETSLADIKFAEIVMLDENGNILNK